MTVGLESDPPSLDPAGNTASLANITMYDALYDGLMRYDLDGRSSRGSPNRSRSRPTG